MTILACRARALDLDVFKNVRRGAAELQGSLGGDGSMLAVPRTPSCEIFLGELMNFSVLGLRRENAKAFRKTQYSHTDGHRNVHVLFDGVDGMEPVRFTLAWIWLACNLPMT